VRVVVDASAAIALLVDERLSEAIPSSEHLAPELIVPEILNVRRKLIRANLDAPSLDVIFELLDRFSIHSMRPHARDAAALSERLDHSLYDCCYVALAIANDAKLVTRDQRLVRKLVAHDLGNVVA
jgi:predicted nucleic acid-binding protein